MLGAGPSPEWANPHTHSPHTTSTANDSRRSVDARDRAGGEAADEDIASGSFQPFGKVTVDYDPQGVAKHFTAQNKPPLKAVRDALSTLEKFDPDNIETTLKSAATKLGLKVGAIVHPTRLAVTGSNVGPSLYHLLEVLGKEKVLSRIDRALGMIGC